MSQKLARQPRDEFARKPLAIGPRVGPKNGASAKHVIARPRLLALNMSAVVPPAFVRRQAPKVPDRKRQMSRVSRFFAKAQARQNMTNGKYETRMMGLRPKISDRGAQSSGPTAKPRTKRVMPRMRMI